MARLRIGSTSAIHFSMLTKQVIRAASGWLELGMPDDALEELKSLSVDDSGERKVLELKLAAQMAKAYWEQASVTALELCQKAVDEPDHFLSAAYCLHETGKTDEARKCLIKGPAVLRELPVFHYNMACYLWTLDEREQAREHLNKAVEMDESFLESARTDRDLVGMDI
jgi:tetratricopeptide (TPR) repeat protein